MILSTPISQLNKIGKVTANKFKKLGLEKAEDLLFYFPFRYDDFTQISTINNLQANSITTIKAFIKLISNKRSSIKKMVITEALVSDQTDHIKIIWFNQPFLIKTLKIGDEFYFSGKVEYNFNGLQITNPSYEKVSLWKKEAIHTGRLVPIYPTTENLTQKQIRFLIKFIIPLTKEIRDWLPEEIKKNLSFPDLTDALQQIHFPNDKIKLEQAIERLKFDELFLIQIQTQQSKKILEKNKAIKINFKEAETKTFVQSLSFQLTDAQKKSAWQILKDLQKNKPMNRLLEGEVGSGKTIIAIITMLNIFLNGYQSVLMVPTEILAQQHFNNICQLLANFNIKIGLITRSNKQIFNFLRQLEDPIFKKNKTKKQNIIDNADIIIGTHSLIQENIKIKNLGLIIIDEQHRFGVEQRTKLITQNKTQKFIPHFLSMTATPIPRSLALVLYGDLDLSIIDELPEQRKKIITKIVDSKNRQLAYDFIKNEIKKGRQIFVLCPLINESDKLGVKSATTEYEKLRKTIFPDFKIGLIHGKLKVKEKESTMQDFLKNKINILVSTSVIEVGIDIPNASVIMIESAERFGLAQLYQFRGRVGRGEQQSYCFLFSETSGIKTKKRLQTLLTAKNSFELAEKDLEIRGPGELYSLTKSCSAQQSGYLSFLKIARLTDYSIIQNARNWAKKILDQDQELKNLPNLKDKIKKLKIENY
ncbi:ATP-dependent DNA helicase RecG [Candidatus Kuenenbacteria bacterium HGW-Kuenenbacteria-1]|uniref:Probable DNA 3'-5' helicase RecG n=1 Tax=Candidatus Kuenenbacteria bacterium HGW-Kuenenbacteria-1 TaxID=2013812 RepID=A0A2N1UN11_9BACT|nr:MAG: ATP-dependent DNA helicase RecG [Candidatus Kuenenbacteria bacterium HGW-Kuenenbacteria-1]